MKLPWTKPPRVKVQFVWGGTEYTYAVSGPLRLGDIVRSPQGKEAVVTDLTSDYAGQVLEATFVRHHSGRCPRCGSAREFMGTCHNCGLYADSFENER